MRAGRFWIGPPWERHPSDAVPVVIDPGRAFGTGGHATTQLCVEHLGDLEPTSLVDVGCGSGVIAIAAALSGWSPVVAVDIDPAAVEAAVRNAAANGVSIDVRVLDLERDELPRADVAVANISLGRVEFLLARLDSSVVVTSGYLERDDPNPGRYRRRERRVRDGWAADVLDRAQ